MAVSSPTFRPIVSIGATSVLISNLSVTTDTPLVLLDGTKQIVIKATNTSVLTIKSTLLGGTFTIPANCVFQLNDLELSSVTLYISSSIPATDIEAIMLY